MPSDQTTLLFQDINSSLNLTRGLAASGLAVASGLAPRWAAQQPPTASSAPPVPHKPWKTAPQTVAANPRQHPAPGLVALHQAIPQTRLAPRRHPFVERAVGGAA